MNKYLILIPSLLLGLLLGTYVRPVLADDPLPITNITYSYAEPDLLAEPTPTPRTLNDLYDKLDEIKLAIEALTPTP